MQTDISQSHRNVLINACLHLFTCSNLLFLYSVNLLWEKVNLLSYVRHKEGVYNKYWFIHTYICINDSIKETVIQSENYTGIFFPPQSNIVSVFKPPHWFLLSNWWETPLWANQKLILSQTDSVTLCQSEHASLFFLSSREKRLLFIMRNYRLSLLCGL